MLALLGATTAAFAVTEALKLERSPIARPRFRSTFSPTCGCKLETVKLSLRLRRDETIDAVVLDGDGRPVRTLVSGVDYVPARIKFTWDGRNDAGALVPDGPYRLRVHLARERRTIVVPNVFEVDTKPPSVRLLGVAPRTLSPDGDGRGDSAKITYRIPERARLIVLVDGARAYERPTHVAGDGTFRWPATRKGAPLDAGTYELALAARDRAGNRSQPTATVEVRVRYVALESRRLHARRSGTLRARVDTDATRARWMLTRPGLRRPLLRGNVHDGLVRARLPHRLPAGRYFLRVTTSGHSTRALVLVRRAR